MNGQKGNSLIILIILPISIERPYFSILLIDVKTTLFVPIFKPLWNSTISFMHNSDCSVSIEQLYSCQVIVRKQGAS